MAGVEAVDLVTGEHLVISAGAVIDATGATGGAGGPFAAAGASVEVMPSLGVHLVVRRDRIPASTGLTIQIPGTSAVPHPLGHALDHRHDGPPI